MGESISDRMNKALGIAQDTADAISEEEGLEVIRIPEIVDCETPTSSDHMQDVNDDYNHSRKTVYQVIEIGTEAIEHLLPLAKEAESPRGFEVVHMLVKTLSEAAKDLLTLHETMNNIEEKKGKAPVVGNTTTIEHQQNTVIVMSPAELLKSLKEKQKPN